MRHLLLDAHLEGCALCSVPDWQRVKNFLLLFRNRYPGRRGYVQHRPSGLVDPPPRTFTPPRAATSLAPGHPVNTPVASG